MNRNSLTLILALVCLATAPSAFSMKYKTLTPVPVFTPPPHTFPPPPTIAFSGCSSESNTIAVGYDVFPNHGIRILCAAAGRIGFWTTPVNGPLVGEESVLVDRFLCPSGHALAGLTPVTEGLTFPFPVCAPLIPNLGNGAVGRGNLVTAFEGPAPADSNACPNLQFIQSLRVAVSSQGEIQQVGQFCNNIETAPLGIEGPGIDLAVRTVGQQSEIGHDSQDSFSVEVFNEGVFAVPAPNVVLELRFDAFAWDFIQPLNMSCREVLARKGLDFFPVGKHCILPGGILNGRGGKIAVTFKMQPVGPSSLRPPTPTAEPLVGFKVSLADDNGFGADPNMTNDFAAFPVKLF